MWHPPLVREAATHSLPEIVVNVSPWSSGIKCITEESWHDPNYSNPSCTMGLLKRHRADWSHPPSLKSNASLKWVEHPQVGTLECWLRLQVLDLGGCLESLDSSLGMLPAEAPSLGGKSTPASLSVTSRSQMNGLVKGKSYPATHSPPAAPHLIQSTIPNGFLLNLLGLVPAHTHTDNLNRIWRTHNDFDQFSVFFSIKGEPTNNYPETTGINLDSAGQRVKSLLPLLLHLLLSPRDSTPDALLFPQYPRLVIVSGLYACHSFCLEHAYSLCSDLLNLTVQGPVYQLHSFFFHEWKPQNCPWVPLFFLPNVYAFIQQATQLVPDLGAMCCM